LAFNPQLTGVTVRVVGLAAVGLVALATPMLSFGGAAATQVSGLRGLVMQGPTAPVCRADDPCEEPARGILLQFRRGGKVVAEVKTTRAGRYSVRLRAGSYAVKTPLRRVGTGLTPRVVRVLRGRIARVDFHLDTGIQ
jgi:hypothetical protein